MRKDDMKADGIGSVLVIAAVSFATPSRAHISAPTPLAPSLTCESKVLTMCQGGFCSDVFADKAAAKTTITFDLTKKAYDGPFKTSDGQSRTSGWKPMERYDLQPGAPNGRLFEVHFSIQLRSGAANAELIETWEEGRPFEARATTTFHFKDGITAITGYRCARSK